LPLESVKQSGNVYTYLVNRQMHTAKICFIIYYYYHLHVSVAFATIIRAPLQEY